MSKLQVYSDANGEWRWRRIGDNNNDIVAESGEGYEHRQYTIDMAKQQFPNDGEPEVWSHDPMASEATD